MKLPQPLERRLNFSKLGDATSLVGMMLQDLPEVALLDVRPLLGDVAASTEHLSGHVSIRDSMSRLITVMLQPSAVRLLFTVRAIFSKESIL